MDFEMVNDDLASGHGFFEKASFSTQIPPMSTWTRIKPGNWRNSPFPGIDVQKRLADQVFLRKPRASRVGENNSICLVHLAPHVPAATVPVNS